jgi:hypothetical protein
MSSSRCKINGCLRFKHLHELDQVPAELHERIFQRLFSIAKIAQLPPEERQGYERSLKDYRDFMSAQDTAHLEGYQEGIEEGHGTGETDRDWRKAL